MVVVCGYTGIIWAHILVCLTQCISDESDWMECNFVLYWVWYTYVHSMAYFAFSDIRNALLHCRYDDDNTIARITIIPLINTATDTWITSMAVRRSIPVGCCSCRTASRNTDHCINSWEVCWRGRVLLHPATSPPAGSRVIEPAMSTWWREWEGKEEAALLAECRFASRLAS